MSGLHTAHFFALAFWAGLVAVEVLYEAAALAGKLEPRAAARLHRWTDRYLEVPALAAVLGTGLLLWARMGWDGGLAFKVGAGLGAIAFNLLCWVLVERRCALETDDQTRVYTWRMVRAVAPGFPLGLVALYLGGARAGWW